MSHSKIISNQESQSVYIKMGKPLTFNFCLNESEVKTEITYYTIYKTTNILKQDGDQYQFYVGKHKQYDNLDFDDYYGSGTILEEQIKEHGKENFKREFIEFCSSEKEMDLREIYWIASTSANCLKYPNCGGMNKSNGGEFYIGNSMKGENHPLYGKPVPEERRRKQSENRKGKCVGSDNHNYGKPPNDEILESFKKNWGKTGEENPFYGRSHNEETLKKNREFNTGRKPTKETLEKLSKLNKGENNHSNPYIHILSTGENYYEVFDKNQRKKISRKFIKTKLETIEFCGIFITRILKDKKEYEYILSNGENFKDYYTPTQKRIILEKFSKTESDVVQHKDVTITRILKDKNSKENSVKSFSNGIYSKYIYILSNGEDYWTFFSDNDRNNIKARLYRNEVTIYKGITITRVLKDKGENKNG